jgi:hypothetical protein
VHVLVCRVCRDFSDERATGWRGFRIDDPDENRPELAFYCPRCAERLGPFEHVEEDVTAESGE